MDAQAERGRSLKNETLLKLLCHNVVVVHQAVAELGIEPVFWPGSVQAFAKSGAPANAS